jgi:Thioredoxin
LDINKFKKEVSGHTYASLIEESLKSGIDSGVQGTPTFFVNGERYEDSWDLETFSNFLKALKYVGPTNHSYDTIQLVTIKSVSKFPLTRYGSPYQLSW